jgi:hypothetical protein
VQQVEFVLTGTSPILVSNPRTANPLDAYTQLIKEVTGKRKRTDDDERQLQRLKWEASLYFDPKVGPYLPSVYAWRSIHEAAKMSKQGKQIERGLIALTDTMPIEYEGPRELDPMWATNRFVDVRDANASGRRIMAVRARFNEWRVKFQAAFSPELLNERDLKGYAEAAGRMIGIGTYRRVYGRFAVST